MQLRPAKNCAISPAIVLNAALNNGVLAECVSTSDGPAQIPQKIKRKDDEREYECSIILSKRKCAGKLCFEDNNVF